MLKLIITLSAVLTGVLCNHMVILTNNENSKVSPFGGVAVQFLTTDVAKYADGMFYHDTEKLTYVDSTSDVIYEMDFWTGDFYNVQLKGDNLAFLYPQIISGNQYVAGSGNKVMVVTYVTDFVISAITPVTIDSGYEICKAHADKNGILFLALNSKADKKHKGGRLYKMVSKVPILVKQYTGDIMDFAFNYEYTLLYVIKDSGKTIVSYDYDNKTLDISNEKVVFTLPEGSNMFLPDDRMTGIETEKTPNYLWVVVTHCGKLLQIQNGKIVSVIPLPVMELTGITFAGDAKALLISTAKEHDRHTYAGGSVMYLSGINATGHPDNRVLW